jgi:hypothetical protein
MVGSGYLCVATVRMNIFWHYSRGARRILRRNSSSSTCTFNPLRRTNSCPPLFIKAQQTEPHMTAQLAALVKRVSELRTAGLKACHCIKEFHYWPIHPLGRRKRCAYKCPWMADPSHEPIDSKLPIWSLEY